MVAVIASASSGVPTTLVELRRLGRILKQRATDVLACFDRLHTSNESADAINGPLEHLHGSAFGFRSRTRSRSDYLACALLETGDFGSHRHLHPQPR